MLNLLMKLTEVKRNIFNHQQKVYTWFHIFKSICPKGTAVPKVPSFPYMDCYKKLRMYMERTFLTRSEFQYFAE